MNAVPEVPEAPNTPESQYNPFEAARLLQAFVECSREMQEVALEMSEIVGDESATEDERAVAFDAMMQALFPGTSTDVLEKYQQLMKSPSAAESAAALRTEERTFADRVRVEMKKKNVTQEQLAKAANISQPAVSNILNRRCRPQRKTVTRFAELLGLSPQDLWPEFES